MKPSMAAFAVALTLGVAACDSGERVAEAPAGSSIAAVSPAQPPAAAVETTAATPSLATAEPLVVGAPAFAVLYPGGAVDGEPTPTEGPAGSGRLVTFTTDDDPEAVVAFYRQRAEAAGLASVMSMNQGEARAYGAVHSADGARVEVVASPEETGLTSVQLTWSAGR